MTSQLLCSLVEQYLLPIRLCRIKTLFQKVFRLECKIEINSPSKIIDSLSFVMVLVCEAKILLLAPPTHLIYILSRWWYTWVLTWDSEWAQSAYRHVKTLRDDMQRSQFIISLYLRHQCTEIWEQSEYFTGDNISICNNLVELVGRLCKLIK